ncbi:hypothetical protein Ancab_021230 [Ancistrocladus abbreviatus]
MALQSADPPTTPSAQVVANAFVAQYYHILHHSPELVYRFYQDSSMLSRQEENGEMSSVTTMQGINDKILSLDYKNFKAEIKTADAQESYKDGVIVLVTGCLTGKDSLRKKFAQSFFLAPQVKGYFVLNDVFRYVDDTELLDGNAMTISYTVDAGTVPLPLDPEASDSSDYPLLDVATSNGEDNQIHVEKETETPDNEKKSEFRNERIAEPQANESHISAAAESSHSSAQEDGLKQSYASVVKVPKSGSGPTKVYVPTNTVRSVPITADKQPSGSVAPATASESSTQISSKVSESGTAEEEVEGHSIFVRNLPLNVTVSQLEAEFKKFGPIKQGGVQVRSNRQQGSCYGFVEFLSPYSMDSAIQLVGYPLSFTQHRLSINLDSTYRASVYSFHLATLGRLILLEVFGSAFLLNLGKVNVTGDYVSGWFLGLMMKYESSKGGFRGGRCAGRKGRGKSEPSNESYNNNNNNAPFIRGGRGHGRGRRRGRGRSHGNSYGGYDKSQV